MRFAGSLGIERDDELAGLGDFEGGAHEAFHIRRVVGQALALGLERVLLCLQRADAGGQRVVLPRHLQPLDGPRPKDRDQQGQGDQPRRAALGRDRAEAGDEGREKGHWVPA